jgi:hypothetical protein
MRKYDNIVKGAIIAGKIREIGGAYSVICPECNSYRFLKTRESARRAIVYNKKCNTCSNKQKNIGRVVGQETKEKMSLVKIDMYRDKNKRAELSKIVTIAMHKPNVRNKHINAMYASGWITVRVDNGQIELINRWNTLGFNFEINYKLKTKNGLYYIDGYDKEKNVVLEIDSKYHSKLKQKKLDLIRQNNIIESLLPTVFWRYNTETNQFNDVYRNDDRQRNKTKEL